MYVVISAKEKNKERWRGRVSKDSILNNGGRQWSPVEEEFEQWPEQSKDVSFEDICWESQSKGKSKFEGRNVLGMFCGEWGAQGTCRRIKLDWGNCAAEVKQATGSHMSDV